MGISFSLWATVFIPPLKHESEKVNNILFYRYSVPTKGRVNLIWLNRIQNPKLLSIEKRKLKHYLVCANHFASICIHDGKLKKYALPTLNLPGM